MILGLGASYATEREDAWGDTARAVGEISLQIRDRAQRLNRDHHILDRSQVALNQAWERAQAYDREHHVLDRLAVALSRVWAATQDYVQRHNIIERSIQSVGRGLEWVLCKIVDERPSSQN